MFRQYGQWVSRNNDNKVNIFKNDKYKTPRGKGHAKHVFCAYNDIFNVNLNY